MAKVGGSEAPEYPEKDYFCIHGMKLSDRIAIAIYLQSTEQTSLVVRTCSFSRLYDLSEQSFNNHYASMSHLYEYPSKAQVEKIKQSKLYFELLGRHTNSKGGV